MTISAQEDCLVCRKHSGIQPAPGGTIYEDDLVFASHSFIPEGEPEAYLGILFLEPKRHISGVEDLTDEEGARMGVLTARLSRALEQVTEADHIYLFVIGHHVPHLHFWLVPRYLGTPKEYWGLNINEWPGAPRGNEEEITHWCNRLRAALQLPGAATRRHP